MSVETPECYDEPNPNRLKCKRIFVGSDFRNATR